MPFEGTFTSANLISHYIERILKPYLKKKKIRKSFFLIDQARVHMTEQFKSSLRALNIEFIYIPASLTSLLQPADVYWFKSMKVSYCQFWNEWFINGVKKVTTKGNLAGPGYENMTKWILKGMFWTP